MKLMDVETREELWIGVQRQERDTDARYQRYRSARNTNTKECDTERVGMPIPNATRY
jgi:hypothetical protein